METRRDVLALILAGGAGQRLSPLTDERAKPSLPFGAVYRLIDFPLSNCMHSGIADVWVLQQHAPHTLSDHLANGRPWDLDRSYGGLKILHPQQGTDESGWYRGNADALYRNREQIADLAPETLLVLSADHVYKLDYRDVLDTHRRHGADVTVVTTRVRREEAGRFGVVEVDGDGRLTGFEYKPDEPRGDLVTTEVFAYDTGRLLDLLDELAADGGGDDDEDSGLGDFGDVLLPRLVADGGAWQHRLEGYWRDVGTFGSYWRAHMELLEDEPALRLEDAAWPIRTFMPVLTPSRIDGSAEIRASLIAPGCRIAGRVTRSVLGPGVRIEEGAEVSEAVLLGEASVGAGARVEHAIVDAGARVAGGQQVLGEGDEIAVLGASG